MFFKIFPLQDLYTFACVWTKFRSTFATLIKVTPKHAFWRHQPLLQVSKNVALSFYFLRTGIKRNHSVPSQDYKADDSSFRCFECSKMQLFEPMFESSHCRGEEWSAFDGWFSWFLRRQLANKWLCTTQNCVVLVVRLRHVQVFWRLFAWKCLVREQISWLILKHSYKRLLRFSKQRHRIFGAFHSTNRHEPLSERLTNCVGSNANKLFWQSNVHAILNVCWSH